MIFITVIGAGPNRWAEAKLWEGWKTQTIATFRRWAVDDASLS